jgi:hypothetical protein
MKISKHLNWFILKKFNWMKLRFDSVKLSNLDKNTGNPNMILFFKNYNNAVYFKKNFKKFDDILIEYLKLKN